MSYTTASTLSLHQEKVGFFPKLFLFVFMGIWIWTLADTSDFYNWLLENTLTFLFLALLTLTFRAYRLSDLSYTFIFVYLLLHIYGAKYTYAQNPFGFWLQDFFHTGRNHYDRIVHFSFGFLLAYPMRDLFLNIFRFPAKYSWILPAEITLSFSAMYELIEWAVADILFPDQGAAYLGTQGDIWDAQKDMCLAWTGSILILLLTFLLQKIFKTGKSTSYNYSRT